MRAGMVYAEHPLLHLKRLAHRRLRLAVLPLLRQAARKTAIRHQRVGMLGTLLPHPHLEHLAQHRLRLAMLFLLTQPQALGLVLPGIATTPTTTPAPSIICEGGTALFKVNHIDLCVPEKFFPPENVSKCVFDKTWPEVNKLKGVMETGGLGDLMTAHEWEVWVCGAQLPCALQVQDWACHPYSEEYEVFVPWGYNRQLGLVGKCPKKWSV